MALQWNLELFAKRLMNAGMPKVCAQRFTTELSGHLSDIQEEERSHGVDDETARRTACRRLGEPDLVFREIIHSYRQQTFIGRHPVLFFACAPMIAVVLGHVLGLFIVVVPFLSVGSDFSDLRFSFPFAVGGRLVIHTLPLLLAAAFAAHARRLALGMIWRLLPACLMGSLLVWIKLTTTIHLITPHVIVNFVPGSAVSILSGNTLMLAPAFLAAGLVARIPSRRFEFKASK